MQHYYENISGWFNFQDFYKKIVENLLENSKIVEIGAWKGCSTAFLAVEIINSGKNIEFNVVDSWENFHQTLETGIRDDWEDIYTEFLNNIKPVKDLLNMKIIRKKSVNAAKLFENNTLDFVYIDGGHDFEDVDADIKAWLPKLKVGGIIAGHDYEWGGVAQAVQENLINFKVDVSTWYQKIGEKYE